MIPVIKTNTKYKFGDKVTIKYGFYRGLSGIITGYFPKSEGNMIKKEIIEYHIKTTSGNLDLLVDEDQIQIIGVK